MSRRVSIKREGFSLIELMIVIAIISVVAAIGLPRYSNSLQSYRATLAAKRIANDLQLAQLRARSSSSSRTVLFTVSSSSYQLPGETDLASSSATYTVKLADLPYQSRLYAVQFGATSGTTSVSFNGFGIPNNGGSITLVSGKVTKTVTLTPLTGAISIQ